MTLHPNSKTSLDWDKPDHVRQKLKTMTEHRHDTLTEMQDRASHTGKFIETALRYSQKDFVHIQKPVVHKSMVIEK